MADLLPQCLIHKILCYLSFRRAAQMSILSKTWRQAWLTLPNLSFALGYLRHNLRIMDNIMERYRDGKIPIEKFDLSYSVYTHGVIPLFSKWLDIALQNDVNDLIFGVPNNTSYPLPMLTILATKSLRELVLTGYDLTRVSLSSGVVANCYLLRKLSLTRVSLGYNMLQTLFNSCPFIVSFIIDDCPGLEKIEVLDNLSKIKSVSIRKFGNQGVKIQAPTLEHLSYFTDWEKFPMLDIDAPNLVSFVYEGYKLPAMLIYNGVVILGDSFLIQIVKQLQVLWTFYFI